MKIRRIYEASEEDNLAIKIQEIIDNETDVLPLLDDDYEMYTERIENACKLIIEYLKKEYNFQINLNTKKYNI